MAEYYGVTRTPEYLMHYGVKGMRWGVRKAIERGDSKRLERHYNKANKKLQKLKDRADVLRGYEKRKASIPTIGAGLVPLAAGVGVPFMAKKAGQKLSVGDYGLSGFNAAGGGLMVGSGLHGLISGNRETRLKGHDKAVKKVNSWQGEMKKAFKGTKYGNAEKLRPDFKDIYTLYEHGTLGQDSNGKPLLYRTPTVSVNGSDLVRNFNSKAKRIFKKRLTDPPVTQSLNSDDKVWLGVQSPSGRMYSANNVDTYLKIRKTKYAKGIPRHNNRKIKKLRFKKPNIELFSD